MINYYYKSNLDDLRVSIDYVKQESVNINQDYDKDCIPKSVQRKLVGSTREMMLSFQGIDQVDFDISLETLEKSVQLFEGSSYFENQRRRLLRIIMIGLSQEKPKLHLPIEFDKYRADAFREDLSHPI